MEFIVYSQKEAIRYGYKDHSKKSIVISINNSYELLRKIPHSPTNNILDVLYLFFDDIDIIDGKEFKKDQGMIIDRYNCAYDIISDKDAENIVNFVNKYKDKIDTIIVHCKAGISRSSGVCAAIMKYLTDDDDPIFSNPRFHPNMRCYRTVLNKFYEKENEINKNKIE